MQQFFKIKAIKIFLFAFILFAAGISNAQIGIGIANPATSAQLDVNSTTKGFLPPRMTQAQRNAIASPTAGLTIWCKDCGVLGELQVYNGATWTNMIGNYSSLPIPPSANIGTQNWMTRNLDVTNFRNGDPIHQIKDASSWKTYSGPAWCYYNFDSSLGIIYGKLYNLAAVNDERGLAPFGWNIPTLNDWTTLLSSLGGEALAGSKMRATSLWDNPNAGVSNESGFTALPSGRCNTDGTFGGKGNLAIWWSSTWGGGSVYEGQWVNYLDNDNNISTQDYIYLVGCGASAPPDCENVNYNEGFAVRCIREDVSIGTQVWMTRNLDVVTYRNGDTIPQVSGPTEWASLTTGAWCYYPSFFDKVYGKLYNWYAVHDPRGLAPAGYHVATDAEWTTLTDYLGGAVLAGDKLKEKGLMHWRSPNAGATNSSGFTALPGGKFENGSFKQMGDVGSWWTSSERNSTNAWYREVNFYDPNVYRWDIKKQTGFSVRCIKD